MLCTSRVITKTHRMMKRILVFLLFFSCHLPLARGQQQSIAVTPSSPSVVPGAPPSTEIAVISVVPQGIFGGGGTRTYGLAGDPMAGDHAFFSVTGDRLLLDGVITDAMDRDGRIFRVELESTKDGNTITQMIMVPADHGNNAAAASVRDLTGLAAGDTLSILGQVGLQSTSDEEDWFRLSLSGGQSYLFSVIADLDLPSLRDIAPIYQLSLHETDTSGEQGSRVAGGEAPEALSFTYQPAATADYYLVVSHAESLYEQPYRLSVSLEEQLLEASASVPFPDTNSQFACGDVDGDGDLDLFVVPRSANNPPGANLYINDGGNFTPSSQSFDEISTAGDAEFGDIDNDGDLDLVAANATGGTWLHKNDGAGNFTRVQDIDGETPEPNQLAGFVDNVAKLGDVDNDGDLDLLLVGAVAVGISQPQEARLYVNDGRGNFFERTSQHFEATSGAVALQLADVDNDDDLDVFFSGDTEPASYLYANDGTGLFSSINSGALPVATNYALPPAIDVLPSGGALGDVDGDGDWDFLSVFSYEDQADMTLHTLVRLYENDGMGALADRADPQQPSVFFPRLFSPFLRFFDVDNDGDADLLMGGANGLPAADVDVDAVPKERTYLFLNDGTGDFLLAPTGFSLVRLHSGVSLPFDMDNDGDLDLLLSGQTDTQPEGRLVFYQNNTDTPPLPCLLLWVWRLT